MKTTMHKKKLTTQANDSSSNRIAIQDLSTEMVELSDEVLSQVCGGINANLSQFIINGILAGGGGGNHEIIPLQYKNSIDAPGPLDGGPEQR
jgi:hypothetical protein